MKLVLAVAWATGSDVLEIEQYLSRRSCLSMGELYLGFGLLKVFVESSRVGRLCWNCTLCDLFVVWGATCFLLFVSVCVVFCVGTLFFLLGHEVHFLPVDLV